jgi:hypothetical protein
MCVHVRLQGSKKNKGHESQCNTREDYDRVSTNVQH